MKRCLEQEIGLNYVNFKTIGDYLILICYYLKLPGTTKTELRSFIRDFERIIDNYKKQVNSAVCSRVVHPDLPARMTLLKNYI